MHTKLARSHSSEVQLAQCESIQQVKEKYYYPQVRPHLAPGHTAICRAPQYKGDNNKLDKILRGVANVVH